jgi:hypothetical protein
MPVQVPGGLTEIEMYSRSFNMSIAELSREKGRGPLGSSGTSSSPDNIRIPKNTPGTVGINDATSPDIIYRDFSPAERDVIRRAAKLALRKVGEAKTEIKAAKIKPSTRVIRFFNITGTAPEDIKNLDVIYANYNIIAGALLGHDNLVIDGECSGPFWGLGKLIGKDIAAYVWSNVRPTPGEEGEINIVTPEFNRKSLEDMARVLIHEVSHRYTGTVDEDYLEDGVGKIDTAKALRNADNYAYFALPTQRPPSLKINVK